MYIRGGAQSCLKMSMDVRDKIISDHHAFTGPDPATACVGIGMEFT